MSALGHKRMPRIRRLKASESICHVICEKNLISLLGKNPGHMYISLHRRALRTREPGRISAPGFLFSGVVLADGRLNIGGPQCVVGDGIAIARIERAGADDRETSPATAQQKGLESCPLRPACGQILPFQLALGG